MTETADTTKPPEEVKEPATGEKLFKDEGPAQETEIPSDDPDAPAAAVNETAAQNAARHHASLHRPVEEVTHPSTQSDSVAAQEAAKLIVPGAAVGPDVAGVVRNEHGDVAYAPPGSHNAAKNGVQQDASGHVSSLHTDNSSASGVRTYPDDQ